MRHSTRPTAHLIAAAAALVSACASASQHPYVAPTQETIVSTTEEREANPPSHLIYIENRSTVPVTVFSISLTGCENVKQQCSPHPTNIHVGPGQRQLAIRVEPSNTANGFGYQFGFSWHADSAGINALNALASNGDPQAKTRLAAMRHADSLERAQRGPRYNELSRTDFATLGSRVRSIRLSPDSLMIPPGDRMELEPVHILLVDSAGVVLGQTQWVRWQVPSNRVVSFEPPSTLVARSPGRVVMRYRLPEEAQAMLPRLESNDVDLPVIVGFPYDAHAPTFEGIAVDAGSKRPLGCARVTLEDSIQNVVATGRTDRTGAFALHAPRPGTYAVQVETYGWAPVAGPFETAGADDDKQQQYAVQFVDRLLRVPSARGDAGIQHAYPIAVSATAGAPSRAKAAKKQAAGPRAIVQSVSLSGFESVPTLNIVGNAPPGSSWIEFVVDSAGHVDPASIIYPAGTDARATGGVDLVLPHVLFNAAREADRPTCELLRMQVVFTAR